MLHYIKIIIDNAYNKWINDNYRRKYDIHQSVKIGSGTDINGAGQLVIGEGSYIGRNCTIKADEFTRVMIGDNVSIACNVAIMSGGYTSADDKTIKRGNIHIGYNAWIGMNVFIKQGVVIGANATIGANSVVTKTVPPGEVWGGVPAKKIR